MIKLQIYKDKLANVVNEDTKILDSRPLQGITKVNSK